MAASLRRLEYPHQSAFESLVRHLGKISAHQTADRGQLRKVFVRAITLHRRSKPGIQLCIELFFKSAPAKLGGIASSLSRLNASIQYGSESASLLAK